MPAFFDLRMQEVNVRDRITWKTRGNKWREGFITRLGVTFKRRQRLDRKTYRWYWQEGIEYTVMAKPDDSAVPLKVKNFIKLDKA